MDTLSNLRTDADEMNNEPTNLPTNLLEQITALINNLQIQIDNKFKQAKPNFK